MTYTESIMREYSTPPTISKLLDKLLDKENKTEAEEKTAKLVYEARRKLNKV